ncbi:MAG: energy transducer TonB [Verrucomicrobiales bacterium]
MTPFLYSINIATLATWLSVGTLGTVAIVVHEPLEFQPPEQVSDEPFPALESTVLTEDFTLGDPAPSQQTDTGTTGDADEESVPFTEQDTLPEPPEMPELANITPLPEVPDLPPPPAKTARAAPAPSKPRPSTPSNSRRQTRSSTPTRKTGGSTTGSSTARGTSGNGGSRGGSGMSDAKRLSGGRMPPPSYPSSARRRGQQGTVVVEFVVGENGRVVSAYAKSPSPWPLLNDAAVRCVRKWRFASGKVTKYVRPIVFKLN